MAYAAALFILCWAVESSGNLLAAAAPSIVQCDSISSKILHRPVGYCIDLPADYASAAPRRYPTLYFLHGLFGNDHRWVDRGGKEIFDRLTADGTIGRFIVVLPDGGETFYINSEDGQDRYEDFFIQELVPFIDQHYRTIREQGGARNQRPLDGRLRRPAPGHAPLGPVWGRRRNQRRPGPQLSQSDSDRGPVAILRADSDATRSDRRSTRPTGKKTARSPWPRTLQNSRA